MRHFIGCDAHKKYSLFVAVDEAGETKPAVRVNHDRESYRTFLRGLPARSSIAVETVGNWYWIVDEMQQAGHQPHLAHARTAKLMMGQFGQDRQARRTRPCDIALIVCFTETSLARFSNAFLVFWMKSSDASTPARAAGQAKPIL